MKTISGTAKVKLQGTTSSAIKVLRKRVKPKTWFYPGGVRSVVSLTSRFAKTWERGGMVSHKPWQLLRVPVPGAPKRKMDWPETNVFKLNRGPVRYVVYRWRGAGKNRRKQIIATLLMNPIIPPHPYLRPAFYRHYTEATPNIKTAAKKMGL